MSDPWKTVNVGNALRLEPGQQVLPKVVEIYDNDVVIDGLSFPWHIDASGPRVEREGTDTGFPVVWLGIIVDHQSPGASGVIDLRDGQ